MHVRQNGPDRYTLKPLPKSTENMFLFSVYRSFSRIDHVLCNDKIPHKFLKSNSSSITLNYSDLKLGIITKRNFGNPTSTWKLSRMPLNSQQGNEEIEREIFKILEKNEHENTT